MLGHHPSTSAAIVAAWDEWRPASVRVGEGVAESIHVAIPGLLQSGHSPAQVKHALAALTLLDPSAVASRRAAAHALDRAAFLMQRSKRYRDKYQDALARHQATSEWPRTAPSGLVPASPQSPRSATTSEGH